MGNVLFLHPLGRVVPGSEQPWWDASSPWGEGWSERIGSRLPEHPAGEVPVGASSVLIPLVPVGGVPMVLYTRRSEHLPTHPGEVSFPGGGRAEGEDLEQAALRETREEVGIVPGDVTVLGHAMDLETRGGVWVRAFVGLVDPGAALRDPLTPGEVEERLMVPLGGLLEGKGSPPGGVGEAIGAGEGTFGRAMTVRSYEGRRLTSGAQAGLLLHYWHLDPETTVWGITGGLTGGFLEAAFDWSPPSAPRPVEGVEDLEP